MVQHKRLQQQQLKANFSKPLKKLFKHLAYLYLQEQLLVADSAFGKTIKVCFMISIE